MDDENRNYLQTYQEVVEVILGYAIVALHQIVLKEQGSVGDVLFLTTKQNVSADVDALLGLDVTNNGQFAVRLVCWNISRLVPMK